MVPTTRLALVAAITLLTAGCAGDRTATDDAALPASAESATVAASAVEAPPVGAPVAAEVTPTAGRPAPAEQLPTAADSAAALAEDVSPEWKMRTRQMEPFADCLEKTRGAPDDVRPTLVAACHRLPDAPERP